MFFSKKPEPKKVLHDWGKWSMVERTITSYKDTYNNSGAYTGVQPYTYTAILQIRTCRKCGLTVETGLSNMPNSHECVA